MCPPKISTMRIDRITRSRTKAGRVLLYLEDGTLLRVTEQEVLDFRLRAGDELEEAQLEALGRAASGSGAKAEAAAMIGRRAMSGRDLQRKLTEKGATEAEARYAAEWLEAIGALDDEAYAASLVRHYAARGYGERYIREKLREKGVPRELWDGALEELGDCSADLDRFLEKKLGSGPVDEKDVKRAADALLRRGFSWREIQAALGRYAELPED